MDCGINARILKCIVLCLAMGYVLSGLIEITYCKYILALDPIMFIINVFLIPYIGCYGALKDKKYALILFIALELITFLVLTINLVDEMGIWSLNYGDYNQCRQHLAAYVLYTDPEVENLLKRTKIQCCGVYGPWDYGNVTLPASCCRQSKIRCQNEDIIRTGCIQVCKDIHNIQEEIKIILLINSVLQIFDVILLMGTIVIFLNGHTVEGYTSLLTVIFLVFWSFLGYNGVTKENRRQLLGFGIYLWFSTLLGIVIMNLLIHTYEKRKAERTENT